MDTVIFNGRVSHAEMLEERGDQLKRYEAEGRLEELEGTHSTTVAWEFATRLFGFLAVAISLYRTIHWNLSVSEFDGMLPI